MNEHDIENLLSGLQPSGPSERLSRNVQKELDKDRQWMVTPVAKHRGWFGPVLWATCGAATALLLVSTQPSSLTPSAAPALAENGADALVSPVTTIRELVDAQDQGIRYNPASKLPEQHLKLKSMERHNWIDPRDGASITLEVPREENVVLPVSFQ